MAVHEFECIDCKTIEETNIPFKEGQVPNCFKCNKPMKKMISLPAGVHFKGSGFYETDYKWK